MTLLAPQPESLWDESLPVEVKELPEDLAGLDVLLMDPELLWPLVERWREEFEQTGRQVIEQGRPTIALETFVRWCSSSATAGGTARWSRRCRTRFICAGSAGSR